MRRKKIKFSPKLQSSSLDDIKRFVPKDALNTPVISEYNTLPTSYQNGGLPKYQKGGIGEGGKPEAIVSSGQNIEALQRSLNNIYPELNLNTEGIWGPKTQAAYQKYKREYSGSPALSNKTGAITSLLDGSCTSCEMVVPHLYTPLAWGDSKFVRVYVCAWVDR